MADRSLASPFSHPHAQELYQEATLEPPFLSNPDLRPNPYRVLPNEHSTQPKSGPNVKFADRSSTGERPSNRRFCCNAATKNSFSGTDGDDGRGISIYVFSDDQVEVEFKH